MEVKCFSQVKNSQKEKRHHNTLTKSNTKIKKPKLKNTHTYIRTLILPPAPLPLLHSPLPRFPPPSRSFASNW